MLFELIAAIVAGFAGAGVILLLNRMLRGRLPRWLMPVAAGGAMIATAIANEYGWYPRTVGALPEGLEVATTVKETAVYRPWTYVAPFVTRFIAVDVGSMRRNDSVADQRIVDVYAFARWTPPRKLGVAVDCAAGRRADLGEGVIFAADGRIEGVTWRDVGAEDPIVQTACEA